MQFSEWKYVRESYFEISPIRGFPLKFITVLLTIIITTHKKEDNYIWDVTEVLANATMGVIYHITIHKHFETTHCTLCTYTVL